MNTSLPFSSTLWPQMPSSWATLRTDTAKAMWTARCRSPRGSSGTSPQRCVCVRVCVRPDSAVVPTVYFYSVTCTCRHKF